MTIKTQTLSLATLFADKLDLLPSHEASLVNSVVYRLERDIKIYTHELVKAYRALIALSLQVRGA